MNEYFYDGYADTTQLEGIFAYTFNDYTFSLNYESVDDDDYDTLYEQMAVQAEYAVTTSFYTFAGYQTDNVIITIITLSGVAKVGAWGAHHI